MNRAERRKKKPTQLYNSKADAWRAMQTMIVKHSDAPQDNEAHLQLVVPAYAALEALTGTETTEPWLDKSGFVYLCEMRAFVYFLAKRINEAAKTQETIDAIAPCFVADKKAEQALYDVGVRHFNTGRYRASDADIEALRLAFEWLDSLLSVSTQGITMSALIDAKRLVDSKLQKLAR
jgi:hypothetical protein